MFNFFICYIVVRRPSVPKQSKRTAKFTCTPIYRNPSRASLSNSAMDISEGFHHIPVVSNLFNVIDMSKGYHHIWLQKAS